MAREKYERKLAAILYADVAGYSRLSGEDEDDTHSRLSESLDLISQVVEHQRGRVVHYAGDAVLAMFLAAVDAVVCAARVQRELDARNANLPDERRLHFRIGINLGDVIEDRGDIYGDGVNVAARLESLAEPGGICISESVRAAVGRKLPLVYEDLGQQQVKNIVETVRAFQARLEPDAPLPEPSDPPDAAPVARPSQRRRRPLVFAGVVALVAAGAAVTWLAFRWTSGPPAEAGRVSTVRASAPSSDSDQAATEAVEALIKSGRLDINQQDQIGTALHVAALKGQAGAAAALIAAGADIEAVSEWTGKHPLHIAAEYGHVDVARLLIERGADIRARDKRGRTPLFLAASNNHVPLAQLLLDSGAEIDEPDSTRGETPLMAAAWDRRTEMAQFLVAEGASVNAIDDGRTTVIHVAARTGNLSLIKFLVAHGADINARDRQDRTPLDLAQDRGGPKAVELLRRLGAED